MSPRHLLGAFAVVLGVQGLALLFLPAEVGSLMGLGPGSAIGLQLFAGGLLAVAILDWMGRGAIYGGVFGRPIVVANLTFAVVTTGTLVGLLLDGALPAWVWLPAGLFALQAGAFWSLMRRPPWDADRAPAGGGSATPPTP